MSQNQYSKLKKIWYTKLKQSGFHDIEQGRKDLVDGMLVNGSSYSAIRGPKIKIDAQREYFYKAEHFLNNHEFESTLHKIIWEYHTNGLSLRDIEKILSNAGMGKYYKKSKQTRPLCAMSIGIIIKKYSNIMCGTK